MDYHIMWVYKEMLIYRCKIKNGYSFIYTNGDDTPTKISLSTSWPADTIYIKYGINNG